MVKSWCIAGLLFGLFFTCARTKGQGTVGQSELSGGVGCQSFYKVIDDAFKLSGDNYRSSGAYNLSYKYYCTRRFSVGMSIAYEFVGNHRSYNNDRQHILTLTPEVSYSYFDKPLSRNVSMRLYWLAAWGVTAISEKQEGDVQHRVYVPLGIQLTPIALRIGKDLAGFVEMGFGYRGLLSAGVSYRFPTAKHAAININGVPSDK